MMTKNNIYQFALPLLSLCFKDYIIHKIYVILNFCSAHLIIVSVIATISELIQLSVYQLLVAYVVWILEPSDI